MRDYSKDRTEAQTAQDFEETCSLLSEGKTWAEVHYIINSLRPYTVSLVALKKVYARKLQKVAQDSSAQYEKERIIEDLDAIMYKAMVQFNESIGETRSVLEQGYTYKSGVNKGKIKNPYKIIRVMKSHGATKFLDIYMKALEKKVKLLDLEKAPQFDINVFLKENKIDDGEGTNMQPIRTEKEAKEFGKDL